MEKALNHLSNLYYADEAKAAGIRLKTPEPEQVNCEFCNNVLRCKGLFLVDGIGIWMQHDRCYCNESQAYWEGYDEQQAAEKEEAVEQEKQQELHRKVSRLFEQSKLGERFKQRTFDNFKVNKNNELAYNSAKKYCENFKQYKIDGSGIIFNGTYGTGKTHLAAAITTDLINQGTSVIFGTLISLLGKIKQTYSTNEDEWNVLSVYTATDLLVIDDLGKEKPSEWVLEKLYTIINDRYENNKPIIITTNYSHDRLINRLTVKDNFETAESIVSRLYEICRGVEINGEDFRKS